MKYKIFLMTILTMAITILSNVAVNATAKPVDEMVDSIDFNQRYDVEVPADSEPAVLRLNTDGDTIVTLSWSDTFKRKLAPYFAIYSSNRAYLKPENKIRLSNVGKTTISNTLLDAIVQVTEIEGATVQNIDGKELKPLIMFIDTAKQYTNAHDGGQSILTIGNRGNSKFTLKFTLVKSGTEEPVKVTSAMYFTDIDGGQGIGETFSNQKRYFRRASMTQDMQINSKNNEVYDTRKYTSYNGISPDLLRTPDFGTYVGVGTGSSFEYTFYEKYKETEIDGLPYADYGNRSGGWSGLSLWGSTPSINAVTSKDTITMTYLYRDKEGNKISSDETNEQTSLESDPKMVKKIFGYTYIDTVRNGDNTFTLVYEPHMTTSFIDEDGNEVKTPVDGDVEKSDIDSYEFVETNIENGVKKHIYRKKKIEEAKESKEVNEGESKKVSVPNTGVSKNSTTDVAVLISAIATTILGIVLSRKK